MHRLVVVWFMSVKLDIGFHEYIQSITLFYPNLLMFQWSLLWKCVSVKGLTVLWKWASTEPWGRFVMTNGASKMHTSYVTSLDTSKLWEKIMETVGRKTFIVTSSERNDM